MGQVDNLKIDENRWQLIEKLERVEILHLSSSLSDSLYMIVVLN
jgi:hypothetical protein